MDKIIDLFKKYKKTSIIIGVILLSAIIYMVFWRGNEGAGTFTVERTDVVQLVILSGKVQTTDKADLGFASSGRISSVSVKNNQTVTKGAVLAQLEIDDLLADLKIKQANLKSANVDIEAAKEELGLVIKQEDAKVQSAYRTLLSSGLALTPQSDDYDVDPPVVGGIYDGQEGQYKISIEKENITLPDLSLSTFGLEKTKRIIDKNRPTMFGTRGLFVSFGDNNIDLYDKTIWYLDIPNKSSSTYLSNLNAYNEAKKNRDLTIQNAESKYKKIITEGDDDSSSVAQAEVEKINAEIRKNTIYAPFSGKVTNIEKEVGENASVGERVISIIGGNKLEIVLQVSELDVSRLTPRVPVSLKFDALKEEEFTGILQTINSRETEIDGVPVYEAFVELSPDERIKTGMSATGTVILGAKTSVLAIPKYFVTKVEGENMKHIVQVVTLKGKTEDREITLGLVGTDSMIEVISGLAEGEKIVSAKK